MSKDKLHLTQHIGVNVERTRGIMDGLTWRNPFKADHYRLINGVYRHINTIHGMNGVTVVGKNHMLDVTFGNSSPVTQVDPWYIGLINNTPTPTLSENDTLASHAGWSEFTTYTGNRKAWDDANAASKVKGTTSTSDFTISSDGTVYGILVASVDTGTGGILWTTGAFDDAVPVVNLDVLKITYGIRT